MVQQMKRELRRVIQERRDLLSPQERQEKSLRVMERLWSLEEFRLADTVFFFISFRSEVDTVPMIRRALAEGKRVCLPYTDAERKEMVASQVLDLEKDLVPGNYDILEPRPGSVRPVPPQEVDVIVMPGVAFDCCGRRLGYGGGYYDRFLDRCDGHRVTRIALCFELQVVEEVPCLDHDHRIHLLVTEDRVVDCDGDGDGRGR